jgi:hypothetical protein
MDWRTFSMKTCPVKISIISKRWEIEIVSVNVFTVVMIDTTVA